MMSAKDNKKVSRILIMAGGTGGHVFPGLSLAHCLQQNGIDVHWLGTPTGLESEWVPAAKIPLHQIKISGLRGKGIKALAVAPFSIANAIAQSCRIIKEVQPDVVIGMGGFVTGPGGIASWIMRRPLIIHEQNAKAGLTNKILARFASQVLEGFPRSFPSAVKVLTVGNPIRREIENLPSPEKRGGENSFRLLVLGGSLGAQALNETLPKALLQLAPEERPTLLHQTGNKNLDSTLALYQSLKLDMPGLKIVPFLEDMAAAYANADMVLCRAGALTVAEVCAAGLPAIFIPYPYAVDDHQTANAKFMVDKNAALCIQQTELTPERLATILKHFALAPQERLQMAHAAYQLRQANVSEKIYSIIKAMICPHDGAS